jgi:hypothetical protein
MHEPSTFRPAVPTSSVCSSCLFRPLSAAGHRVHAGHAPCTTPTCGSTRRPLPGLDAKDPARDMTDCSRRRVIRRVVLRLDARQLPRSGKSGLAPQPAPTWCCNSPETNRKPERAGGDQPVLRRRAAAIDARHVALGRGYRHAPTRDCGSMILTCCRHDVSVRRAATLTTARKTSRASPRCRRRRRA